MEYIISFENTNAAIKAEECLLKQGVQVSVLPLPSQIRAGCGICLRVAQDEIKRALEILEKEGITETSVFEKTNEEGTSRYQEIEDTSALRGQSLTSLLDHCTSGGCGAKIGPGELSKVLNDLPVVQDENLIVGYDSTDDAGVYRIDEKHSLITTIDFFPPMVHDPKSFGKIAAANALSDVYAMGGRPLTVLNLVCFPQALDIALLKEILAGGAEKVKEASAVLAGGHSIYDKEPKYGLAVTGIVDTDKVIRNNTPEEGHRLILTKPLGVGIIMAALRGGVASTEAVAQAVASMERLNRYAAEKMQGFTVSACTDITGFGLLAHALEMASDKVSLRLFLDAIPYFEEAYQYASDYLVTAAGQRNRNHLAGKANVDTVPFALQELLFDPQTSGGLLIAVASEEADELLAAIQTVEPLARIVGEVIKRKNDTILFE